MRDSSVLLTSILSSEYSRYSIPKLLHLLRSSENFQELSIRSIRVPTYKVTTRKLVWEGMSKIQRNWRRCFPNTVISRNKIFRKMVSRCVFTQNQRFYSSFKSVMSVKNALRDAKIIKKYLTYTVGSFRNDLIPSCFDFFGKKAKLQSDWLKRSPMTHCKLTLLTEQIVIVSCSN